MGNALQRLSVTLQVQLKELRTLACMVEAFAATHRLPDRTTFIINLGLDELITNVLTHGRFADGVQPDINVELSVQDDKSVLIIESNDAEFDPTLETNPDTESDLLSRAVGGLGLHLVKEQASRTSYEFVDGKNRLTLEYDMPGPS